MKRKQFAQRRSWTRADNRALLAFAIRRKNEFVHTTKKKFVHKHLLDDMNSSYVSGVPFTLGEIKNKLKTLKRQYRDSINNNERPSQEYFTESLEDLFGGDKSLDLFNSNKFSIGIGDFSQPFSLSTNAAEVSQSNTSTIVTPKFEPTPATSTTSAALGTKEILRETENLAQKLEFQQWREQRREERHKERELAKERRHAERRRWHEELINLLKNEAV